MMPLLNIEQEAEILVQKIKHYLITGMGSLNQEASNHEFYRAFCHALREDIMMHWAATEESIYNKQCRTVYYFSMEYLPGRILGNNITNLQHQELVRLVTQKCKRNLQDIIVCEADPGLGNGGLGRLASCFLDSLASQHYPARAYGLRYQYGIFEQNIVNGQQIERPDCWLLKENPWLFRRDGRQLDIKLRGTMVNKINVHNEPAYELMDPEIVTAIPYDIPIVGYSDSSAYSVVTLRLWTTRESPYNFQLQSFNAGQIGQAAENTNITHVLYPADHHHLGQRTRLKQEFLLVSASLQDIIRDYSEQFKTFDEFSDKIRIQINDTHPALVIAELMRILTKVHHISWDHAWRTTQECTSYTNHTVLKEALEEWDTQLIKSLLPRQYEIIERINLQLCNDIRKFFPSNEDKVRHMSIIENQKVRMANLSIYGSHCVNGVAKLHTEILKKRVFQDFHDCWPGKFLNVTNGVTQRRWLLHCNPELAEFITTRIGNQWVTNFKTIQDLSSFASDIASQTLFLEIKRRNKERLITFLQTKKDASNLDRIWACDHSGEACPQNLDVLSLFDVQIKRIHEYKRQLMNVLHVLMLYYDILDTESPRRQKRTVIVAGKAAPGYEAAKHVILLIHCLARLVNNDRIANDYLKIVFIENYNVSKAQLIIPAADLSQQISTAGMEASGTGNMKLGINGALTIGTEDGANIEMHEAIGNEWWPFCFGHTAEELDELRNNASYKPWDIYMCYPKIRKAVDALSNGTLARNAEEQQALNALCYSLFNKHQGKEPDSYFVLKDLWSFYETQRAVDKLYQSPNLWAETAIHNIAGLGSFSSDVSIKEYAEKIWHLEPCPINREVLEKIRQNFSENDRHIALDRLESTGLIPTS